MISFLNVRSPQKDLVKSIFVSFQVPMHISEEMTASVGFNLDNNQNSISVNEPLALLQYQIVSS